MFLSVSNYIFTVIFVAEMTVKVGIKAPKINTLFKKNCTSVTAKFLNPKDYSRDWILFSQTSVSNLSQIPVRPQRS